MWLVERDGRRTDLVDTMPRGFAGAELDENHELTEKVRRGGQSRGGVRRRTRRRSRWSSQAQVQQGGLPERGRPGRVDASTLQEGEAGASRSFNNTASVGASRWSPPLVDEDWHAMCPAICKGVEGAQWEKMCYKFVEMNNEENVRRAKAHWKIRDARERGDAHYDQTSEQHIVNRDAVRQDLWNKHVWEEAGSSTAGVGRKRNRAWFFSHQAASAAGICPTFGVPAFLAFHVVVFSIVFRKSLIPRTFHVVNVTS